MKRLATLIVVLALGFLASCSTSKTANQVKYSVVTKSNFDKSKVSPMTRMVISNDSIAQVSQRNRQ